MKESNHLSGLRQQWSYNNDKWFYPESWVSATKNKLIFIGLAKNFSQGVEKYNPAEHILDCVLNMELTNDAFLPPIYIF